MLPDTATLLNDGDDVILTDTAPVVGLAVMLPELSYAHRVFGMAVVEAFAAMVSFVVPL